MKIEYFLIVAVFLSVFFLVTAAVVFYLRHWASRVAVIPGHALVEGRYFKRYIPEPLRPKYDAKRDVPVQGVGRRMLWAKMASAVVVVVAIAVPINSIIQNFDVFLSPIDLEPHEIAALDYTQHQWRRDVDHQLPKLPEVIAKISDRGFIVPFTKGDKEWLQNGVNLNQVSFEHWKKFAEHNHFKMVSCEWGELRSCYEKRQDWIILVLPGHWDFSALDAAMAKGASVIVYGPPAQLFNDKSARIDKWQGLVFEEILKNDSGEIILRGDQLLTLGLDAGLVVNAYSPFKGFIVFSENPQAISFGSIYEAGGDGVETRLYAKSVGDGRLVWMDFPPEAKDHSRDINVTHLNSIMAAIFRYLSRQSYSALATWPQGKKFAALLDEDTEDQFDNAEAVVELAKRKSYPISWYILSDEALRHRGLTRAMSEVGEIACHGDNHAVFTKSNKRDQVIRIGRCQKVLTEITGVKPVAFRPPEEMHNSATVDAIINNNMTHYIADSAPDRAVPEVQVSLVNGKSLVSIPRMVTDDYEIWHVRRLNYEESVQLIDDEVDWMSNIGGLYMFSFHTQYMGNRDNLKVVEHLGDKLKREEAYFETSKTISEWWRLRADMQRGDNYTSEQVMRFNPVVLSVNSRGELLSTPYNSDHDNKN